MKTYKSIVAILTVFALWSCNEDGPEYIEEHFPSGEYIFTFVSRQDFSFSNIGGETDFYVENQGMSHSISDLPGWLTLNVNEMQDYGNSSSTYYLLAAAANYEIESRSSIFNVVFSTLDKSRSFTQPMTVEQAGYGLFLRFADSSATAVTAPEEVPSSGGFITAALSTNCPEITTSCSISGVTSEYKYTKPTDSGSLQELEIYIPANNSAQSRSLSVYIEAEGVSSLIYYIKQKGISVDVESTYISFPASGGSREFSVSSSSEWSVVQPSAAWCNVVAGTGKVTVQCTENSSDVSRTTEFNIVSRNQPTLVLATIEVEQAEPAIEVTPSNAEIANTGGTVTVTVKSDVSWDKVSLPDWITASVARGNAGNTTVTLTVEENTALNSRTGNVAFTREGWTKKALMQIEQAAFVPEISNNSFVFDRQGGTMQLTINNKNSWRIVSDGGWPQWLSATPNAGTGNGVVSLTTTANESVEDRHATIYVDFGSNKREPVEILQRGLYLDINCRNLDFTVYGGTTTLEYSTNSEISYSKEAFPGEEGSLNWLLLKKEPDNKLKVTAAYNNSPNPRRCYLILTPSDPALSSIRIPVTQGARDIECSATSISFFFEAGVSQVYTVTSVGECEIGWSSQPDWATLDVRDVKAPALGVKGINEFTITTTENDSTEPRKAIIIISLMGLKSGESKTLSIEVTQYGKGIILDRVNWGSDQNWNPDSGNPNFEIKINNVWGEDNNWN